MSASPRSRAPRARLPWIGLFLIGSVAWAAVPAAGESVVRLRPPSLLGALDADTYDLEGRRLGDAELSVLRNENGVVEMRSLSMIGEGGASQEVRAKLQPVGDDGELRLLYQQSESHDEQGRSLGLMKIDHRRRVAECGVPEWLDDDPAEVKLPTRDRVVNVPLNLLFEPLVDGEAEEVDFQILLCRAGARLVDATAKVEHELDEAGRRLVEVRYELDFGLLSPLAAPFMPRLSFWFDDKAAGSWVGHRIPLFSKGPTVMVVRQGFDGSVFSAP